MPLPNENESQLRKLLEERRKNDPILTFQPSVTQCLCYNCMSTIRVLYGPTRGGKTALGAVEIAAAALRKHPLRSTKVKGRYIIVASSKEHIRDVWCKKIFESSELKGPNFDKPLIPKHEVEHTWMAHGGGAPTPKDVDLKNGNSISFVLSGDKHSWKRLQGKGDILGVAIDEAVGYEKLWIELNRRLVDGVSNEQVKREAGGSWLLWTATQTEPNDILDGLIDNGKKNGITPWLGTFKLGLTENPAIDPAARAMIQEGLGGDIVGMGDNISARNSLLIFPQFNLKRHVLKEDYEETELDNLWLSFDPGMAHPAGLIMAAINEKKPLQIKVIREHLFKNRETLDQWVNMMCEWLDGRSLECLILDVAAKKTDYNRGTSYAHQIEQALLSNGVDIHRGVLYGRNIHKDTQVIVQRYLDPDPGNFSAEPLLVINPSCGMAANQMMKYRMRPSETEVLGTNVHKKDDDLVDPIRYLISRQPSFCTRMPNPRMSKAIRSVYPSPSELNKEKDPYEITPDMTPDMVRHLQQLQWSEKMLKESLPENESCFGNGVLGGW